MTNKIDHVTKENAPGLSLSMKLSLALVKHFFWLQLFFKFCFSAAGKVENVQKKMHRCKLLSFRWELTLLWDQNRSPTYGACLRHWITNKNWSFVLTIVWYKLTIWLFPPLTSIQKHKTASWSLPCTTALAFTPSCLKVAGLPSGVFG